MAMSQAMPELTEADGAVLTQLAEGARTQGFLIDNTDHTRGQIQRRLDALVMGEYITKIHDGTALYEITERGMTALGEESSDGWDLDEVLDGDSNENPFA